jgi:hypothetical protein
MAIQVFMIAHRAGLPAGWALLTACCSALSLIGITIIWILLLL